MSGQTVRRKIGTAAQQDGADLRDVMAGVCAPVAIATTSTSGRPHGTTVSTFTWLSLTPPLVTIALHQKSDLLRLLRRTRRVGINLLSVHQEQLARDFAHDGVDRFSTAVWAEDHGLPMLHGSIGWVVCDSVRLVRGGDHDLVVGQVVHARHMHGPPLVYHERRFGTHSRFAEPELHVRLPRDATAS